MKFIGYGVSQRATNSVEGRWPMPLEEASVLCRKLNGAAGAPNYVMVPLHAGDPFVSQEEPIQDSAEDLG